MLGPDSLVGLVEDSDEDHVAFMRLARQEVPGVQIVRWASAEALLDTLIDAEEEEPGARVPDVVVLDLNLPGIDGCELVRRLRGDAATRTLPVFVLSGSERQADVDRCYAAGANAYLTKPGSVTELRSLVQMLFRTMSTFKAPSAPVVGSAGGGDAGPTPSALDQAVIDAERRRYEDELRRDRDRERAGRERAEALQRLTSRLANAGDARDVERSLVEALTASHEGVSVRVVAPSPENESDEPLVMPGAFGEGTSVVLPLRGHGGEHYGVLRMQTPADLSENDEAFLHGAVSAAVQALTRVGRVAELARRARVAATDLPVDRWWSTAIEDALRLSRTSGRPLSLVVVLPTLLDLDGAEALSPVEADAQMLAILDAWRDLGHDLLSPSGGERWVALMHDHVAEADDLAGRVAAAMADRAPFVWGSAEWDRKEDAEALLSRAATGLARGPGGADRGRPRTAPRRGKGASPDVWR